MYAIVATRTVIDNNGERTRQIPTFYLDEKVQGIVGPNHAKAIARDILDNDEANITYAITALKVD